MPKETPEPIIVDGYYLVTCNGDKMVRYFKDGEAYLWNPDQLGEEHYRGSVAQYDTVELIEETPNASQKD